MKRICKTVGIYLLLMLLVAGVGLALEYVVGLLPQDTVLANYTESCKQFEEEGFEPFILNRYRADSRLNNYSEQLILHYSVFMDTARDPAAILTNPAAMPKEYENPKALADLADETPNSGRSRYWMGFRVIVRTLLTLMNYSQMRQLLLWVFGGLAVVCLLLMQRKTGSMAVPIVYAASLLAMNPIVVSTSFQYSCCFLLALLGTSAMCFCRTDVQRLRLLFLLGLLTQFFDFYTAPLVTLGYPLLTDCVLQAYSREPRRQKQWQFVLGGTVLWLLAYGGIWLLKLALTELFTDHSAFATAFLSFSGRTGIVRDARYDYSIWTAYKACLTVLGSATLLLWGCATMALLIRALCRRCPASAWLNSLPVLFIALLPLAWIAVAAQPTIIHSYFQYRSIAPSLLGVMLWPLLPPVLAKNSPDDRKDETK